MIVAIAVDGTEVTEHFGHCSAYLIFKIEENKVVDQTLQMSPGHVPGYLPEFLSDLGVGTIITGGLGIKAKKMLEERGITVVTGATGEAADVIVKYLDGTLVTENNSCDH